jgi:hypothetical protein
MPKKLSKPKVGRPSEGRKPVTMRLTKHALTSRNILARAWGCDKTEAVEQALALCERLAITGNLPSLPALPNNEVSDAARHGVESPNSERGGVREH